MRKWMTCATLSIDGEAVVGEGSEERIEHPATGDVVGTWSHASQEQVDEAVTAAWRQTAGGGWAEMSGDERSQRMWAAYAATVDRRDELISSVVTELGCPVATARSAQVDGALRVFQWFAEAARRDRTEYLAPDFGSSPSRSVIRQVPSGVVAALSPYNFPLLMTLHKVGAALAAGCSVVVVPSPRGTSSVLLLGEVLQAGGLPPGLVNVVAGGVEVGRAVVGHPLVRKVSFTGSVTSGMSVMREASAGVKGVVLELGGKAPALFLPDADLERHIPSLVGRYVRNAGQACQVPCRIIVHESQYESVVSQINQAIQEVVVGDPWEERTEMGPVVSADHKVRVLGFCERALEKGGKVLARGDAPEGAGHWVAPQLIGNVSHRSEISQEEVFGPIATVYPYTDSGEALALANDTKFGLAAYVYGKDEERCAAVARGLRAGSVYVNGGGASRPDAPTGGFGMSGFGRERGEEGIREFLQPQHLQWSLR